jgi:predicted PurR-regulated permease PerM
MDRPAPSASRARDLTRTTLAVLFLGSLLGAAFWVLRPFLGPAIWAAMIVVASWPMMRRLESLLWRRRGLAVTAMTLLLLLLFVIPLVLAIGTLAGNADRMVEWARLAAAFEIPEKAPAWLAGIPLVGSMLVTLWEQAAVSGAKAMAAELLPKITPYAGDLTRWFVAEVGSLGLLLLQFLMTVAIAALMYAQGEEGAALVRRFAERLAGSRGAEAVQLAGDAVRGVALGVGVTALVQSVLSGVALAVAGVPAAGMLTALMFMLCIAQIGPTPVLVPAAIWLFWSGATGWGVFVSVVAVIAVSLDNVLRPVLIRMGADLPMLLIFAGVIGGLFAFGLVGIFVGPVVLAVGWRLLAAWLDDSHDAAHSDAG